ncbi:MULTISPECIES: heavy metal translocating P-type ATPase [unclassified Paenibacillus]|uniref:heavy metal translocating P-type ATPase n=1 Tax=unclassified Paenibacillus TaxID=185978 RepID=UPI002405F259|nr:MULTISPECIES: heavy metal translocating P-type ATPase [unclassified Paenibacillus]MDF9841222.1 Cd2+/Zn2+-exporting ATPase [Paenibacillus sp. PastF-2]MDF9847606.1 Cd2+/Zn2+-exporting ATPase [Paenibacillus sp. PastM-2]MDF9854175.1 Cd2+/Zn2+-exporting ATPase [Paenibacillus sp. PastF-1]MDH6479654.1 Cd2+/Zn2+-exporting ATPase [Paenibacillus sp. PastH-2]MDH6505319.1 Cd2+/Zn2+-exporting ATPase [Paenibacillus sp. PastM-3]
MVEVNTAAHPEASALRAVWEKNGGILIAASCLVLIALAWILEKQGLQAGAVVLFVLAYAVGGYRKALEGLETLIKDKDLDVDLLMVVAAIGAAAIGYWLDGAILIFIFCLSGALEEYSMEKTNQDIAAILKYRPEEAVLLKDGIEVTVRASGLLPEDVVRVRPGERIPCDGMILEGSSAVDQSNITGESVPVDKMPEDEVYAGTMNGQGALLIRVTKTAEDTLLSRIIHMVQEAKHELPPSQLFVERFEGFYAKAVVAAALLLMVLPPYLLDWSWEDTIYRAMIFLVVASPCALVSSIMPAVLSGISNAARKGVLFKGGVHLEGIGGVQAVVFDKTGTLTEGKPAVTNVCPAEGVTEAELLAVAASLEKLSRHPIASAVVEYADARGFACEPAEAMQDVTGLGVSGMVNGLPCVVGKRSMLHNLEIPELYEAAAKQLEAEGKTALYVEADGRLIGLLAVQDVVRSQAAEAVASLKAMNKTVIMLTGDARHTAEAIARKTGIDEVYAEMLPDGKLEMIRELTRKYGKVAMVGDGVNDAPALAAASVGIAMGAAGSDVALETANVVLMNDDITKIPYAITLGSRTTRVIKQNITFALAVIVILVISNFSGGLNLPSGVVSHEGSTLLVILSGLRLLR